MTHRNPTTNRDADRKELESIVSRMERFEILGAYDIQDGSETLDSLLYKAESLATDAHPDNRKFADALLETLDNLAAEGRDLRDDFERTPRYEEAGMSFLRFNTEISLENRAVKLVDRTKAITKELRETRA